MDTITTVRLVIEYRGREPDETRTAEDVAAALERVPKLANRYLDKLADAIDNICGGLVEIVGEDVEYGDPQALRTQTALVAILDTIHRSRADLEAQVEELQAKLMDKQCEYPCRAGWLSGLLYVVEDRLRQAAGLPQQPVKAADAPVMAGVEGRA